MEVERLSHAATSNGGMFSQGMPSMTPPPPAASGFAPPPTSSTVLFRSPHSAQSPTIPTIFSTPLPHTGGIMHQSTGGLHHSFGAGAGAGAGAFAGGNVAAAMAAAAAVAAAQGADATPPSALWGGTAAMGGGGGTSAYGGGGGARKRSRDMDTAPPPLQLKTYIPDRSQQAQDNGKFSSRAIRPATFSEQVLSYRR